MRGPAYLVQAARLERPELRALAGDRSAHHLRPRESQPRPRNRDGWSVLDRLLAARDAKTLRGGCPLGVELDRQELVLGLAVVPHPHGKGPVPRALDRAPASLANVDHRPVRLGGLVERT